jgi:hypothetical protein
VNRNDLLETVGHLLEVSAVSDSAYYRWAVMGLLHQWPCGAEAGEPFPGEGLLLKAWDFANANAAEVDDVASLASVIADRLCDRLHDDAPKWGKSMVREHIALFGVATLLVGSDEHPKVRAFGHALTRLDAVLEASLPHLTEADQTRARESLAEAGDHMLDLA